VHDNRRTRLVLGVLLIIAITLITLDFRDGGASPARGLGADIFGPIERVTHDVTDPVASCSTRSPAVPRRRAPSPHCSARTPNSAPGSARPS
jgi:hypothetical protein